MTAIQAYTSTNTIRYILIGLMVFFAALAQASWAHDDSAHLSEVRHLKASEARALLASNPSIKILDVRTKAEYKRGHIQGAIRNNYFSTRFKKRLRTLDRNTPYLVHCKSGHRSGRVVKIMRKEGFTNILHLDGGYDAWKKLPALSAAAQHH